MDTTVDSCKFIEETAEKLKASTFAVFCSSSGSLARSRTVDYVNKGLEIGFFTWEHTDKVREIAQNPNVSVCSGGITVEGTACSRPISHEANSELLAEYAARLPDLYTKFTTLPGVVFVSVMPKRISRLTPEPGALCVTECDLSSSKCTKKKLSDW